MKYVSKAPVTELGRFPLIGHMRFPQWIMTLYLAVLLVMAFNVGIDPAGIFNDAIVKFAMNGVMVLALIPMVNAGMGINFGLSVGVTAGIVGMLLAVQCKLTGTVGFAVSILLSLLVAVVLGMAYGALLNRFKGNEEIVGMFAGYSFIPFMNILYTLAPFTNRQMLYPVGGTGLRPKINLDTYFAGVLDHSVVISIGSLDVPVVLLLAYVLVAALLVWLTKSLLGDAMAAIAENETFAGLSGIRTSDVRIVAVVCSTVLAAIAICIYAQSYGFLEAYDGPGNLVFPAVSALLIGGAGRNRATIMHAIIGTFLYQTTYLLSVPVANALLMPQMAEILRMLMTNVIILYAFFYDGRGRRAKIQTN